MEFVVPSSMISVVIAINLILLISAIVLITRSQTSLSSKTFALLLCLFLPIIGSLFTITN